MRALETIKAACCEASVCVPNPIKRLNRACSDDSLLHFVWTSQLVARRIQHLCHIERNPRKIVGVFRFAGDEAKQLETVLADGRTL